MKDMRMRIQNPVKHLRRKFSRKFSQQFSVVDCACKRKKHRLTGFWHTRLFRFLAFTVISQHLNNMAAHIRISWRCLISSIFQKSAFPDQKKFYLIFFQTFNRISRKTYQQIPVNDNLPILVVSWPHELLKMMTEKLFNIMTGNLVHICFWPAEEDSQWSRFCTINP